MIHEMYRCSREIIQRSQDDTGDAYLLLLEVVHPTTVVHDVVNEC